MSDLRVTVTSRELNETFHSLTLEFSAVQLSDSGVYTCNANNQLLPDGTEPSGSDVSQQFELFVQSELVSVYNVKLHDFLSSFRSSCGSARRYFCASSSR